MKENSEVLAQQIKAETKGSTGTTPTIELVTGPNNPAEKIPCPPIRRPPPPCPPVTCMPCPPHQK